MRFWVYSRHESTGIPHLDFEMWDARISPTFRQNTSGPLGNDEILQAL
jgi:hypothetical protein